MASPADLMRIVANMNMGINVAVQNVYYNRINATSGQPDSDVVGAAGRFLEDVYTPILNDLPGAFTFEDYKVTNVTADVDLGVSGFPTLTVGQSPGERTPEGIAGLVRGTSDTPGHEARKYFGPFVLGNLVDGLWDSSFLIDLTNAGLAAFGFYDDPVNNVDFTPIVLDRLTGTQRPISLVQASATPAYQRRRKPGVGI